MCENGQGIARNIELARHWYERAAKQGDAKAENALKKLPVAEKTEHKKSAVVAELSKSSGGPGSSGITLTKEQFHTYI